MIGVRFLAGVNSAERCGVGKDVELRIGGLGRSAFEGVDPLLERAARGEVGAFEGIVRTHDTGLRTLAARLVGESATEDVLQDAYLKAFRALRRGRPPTESVEGWLYRIVYRTCLDELRWRRRHPKRPLLDLEGDQAGESNPAEVTATLRADLATALESLSEDQRAAVILVDALGFGYREAGEILRIRRGTVASRLNHAREVLRRALALEDGTQDAGKGEEQVEP